MTDMTEAHLELYDLTKQNHGDRYAHLLMTAITDRSDRVATKDDIALLGSELRVEMADIRTEISDLRTEMHQSIGGQTRTLMFGLIGSVSALAITQIVTTAITN